MQAGFAALTAKANELEERGRGYAADVALALGGRQVRAEPVEQPAGARRAGARAAELAK